MEAHGLISIRKRAFRRFLRCVIIFGTALYAGVLYTEETVGHVATKEQIADVYAEIKRADQGRKGNKRLRQRARRRLDRFLTGVSTLNVDTCPLGRIEELADIFHEFGAVGLQCHRRAQHGRQHVGNFVVTWFPATQNGAPEGVALPLHRRWPQEYYLATHTIMDGHCGAVRMRKSNIDVAFIVAYAPQATSHEKRKEFWKKLNRCLSTLPRRTMIILMGDLNAWLAGDAEPPWIGGRGLTHTCNANGKELRQLAAEHGLAVLNTLGKGVRGPRHNSSTFFGASWIGTLVDFILLSRRGLKFTRGPAFTNFTLPTDQAGRKLDHRPVTANIRLQGVPPPASDAGKPREPPLPKLDVGYLRQVEKAVAA